MNLIGSIMKSTHMTRSKKPKPTAEPEVLDPEDTQDDDIADPAQGELSGNPTTDLQSLEIPEPEVRALSPTDPLRRYMEEVRRYSLMDAQEEFQLAARLKETGDIDAAKRLVQANLRLVVKIAYEYRNYYSNLLDLIQEGNIGLMKAVSKFDPTRGARLGYYSSWWIRSYILKYLLDNFRLVKIGTTQAQKKLFYHLLREKDRLEAQGQLAGPKLLAERLDVREKDVIEMQQRLSGRGGEVSLDTPLSSDGEEGGSTYSSLIPDAKELPDETLAREQLLSLLEGRLPEFQKTLKDKELRILKDRLLSEEPKTLQEVADLYGLTRERARQIEVKVLQKLREFLAPLLRSTEND
jgi:RNA polymerase sigma-32 factor